MMVSKRRRTDIDRRISLRTTIFPQRKLQAHDWMKKAMVTAAILTQVCSLVVQSFNDVHGVGNPKPDRVPRLRLSASSPHMNIITTTEGAMADFPAKTHT